MGRNSGVASLLAMVILFSGLSGCFGDDLDFNLSGDEYLGAGIPGSLTMACLSSQKYTSMILKSILNPVTNQKQVRPIY